MKIKVIIYLIVLCGFSNAEVCAKELFNFNGRINLSDNTFELDLDLKEDSSIKARGSKASGEDYHLNLDLEHIKSPFFEISSQIESSLVFGHNQESVGQTVFGRLSSQYSLVDYKPIDELSGRFEIKDSRIYFTSLEFANIGWNGYLEYIEPFGVDLIVQIHSIPVSTFLEFWVKKDKFDSSGIVSGEIKLSGTLNELYLKGNLQAYDGHIESLKYDNIHLNAAGIYPNIEVNDTIISKSDGVSFSVAGIIDISEKDHFKRQVEALNASPIVTDTASKTEWTIKRVKGMEQGATEFKYLLRKEDASTSTSEESAMLGVEQKLEF